MPTNVTLPTPATGDVWGAILNAGIRGIETHANTTETTVNTLSDRVNAMTPGDVKAVYGALGNGVADDTGAIQSALDAEDVVYLPAGNYRITAALEVPPDTKVFGAGDRVTTITQATNNTPVLVVTNAGIEITDLRITYTGLQASSATNANGLDLHNAFECKFERLHISRAANGICLPANPSGGNYMASCSIRDIEIIGYSIYALNLQTDNGISTGSVFSNIYIHNNVIAGVRETAQGAVFLAFHSDTVIDQLNIEHSIHTNNSFILSGCESMDVNGLHIEGIEPVGDFGGLVGVTGGTNLFISTMDVVFCFFMDANIPNVWGIFKVENDCNLQVGILRERSNTVQAGFSLPLVYGSTNLTTTQVSMRFVDADGVTGVLSGSSTNPFVLYNGAARTTGPLAVFRRAGTLATGAGVERIPVSETWVITGVRLTVNTAPTGAAIICDVNKNGTTIFTTQANRPQIAAAANAGGPGTTPDVTAVGAGDYLTLDIDQIGSGTAGADLVVSVIGYRIVT